MVDNDCYVKGGFIDIRGWRGKRLIERLMLLCASFHLCRGTCFGRHMIIYDNRSYISNNTWYFFVFIAIKCLAKESHPTNELPHTNCCFIVQ